MARARMLSRTLGSSRRFNAVPEHDAELAEFAQLLYALLIPHSDDFGRLAGDAYTIRLTVFPGSHRTIEEFERALDALHYAKLVTRYPTGADMWLQINKFEQHQSGLHKRTASRIPDCPGTSGKIPVEENLTELNLELRTMNSTEPRAAIVDAFRAAWKTAYGYEHALVDRPLDIMRIDQHLRVYDVETLTKAIAAYFETQDPYVLRARHSFKLFLSDPVKYLAREKKPKATTGNAERLATKDGNVEHVVNSGGIDMIGAHGDDDADRYK